MNFRLLKKPLLVITILLIPSLAYVLLSTGDYNYYGLPYYGPKLIEETTGDTIFYTISDFQGVDQSNALIATRQLAGDYFLVSFICDGCQKAQDRILSQLQQIQHQFKYDNFKQLTIVVNNLNEIEKLNNLSEYSLSEKNWHFLSVSDESIKTLSKDLDIASLTRENANDSLFLIDQHRHIRGRFDGKQYLEVKELGDAIKALKAAEYIPTKIH